MSGTFSARLRARRGASGADARRSVTGLFDAARAGTRAFAVAGALAASCVAGCVPQQSTRLPAPADESTASTEAATVETVPAPTTADGGSGTAEHVGGEVGGESSARSARAALYECPGGHRFLVRYGVDHAWLGNPSAGFIRLERSASASGEKFAADGLMVWSKGEEALIETRGERHTRCRIDRAATAWEQARLDGVAFRALGNEPGWIIEIDDDHGVDFTTDYGQTRLRFGRPERSGSVEDGEVRYEARGDGEIFVVLSFVTCNDDMSGESFPVRAEVRFRGRTYRGCGRRLDDTHTTNKR